MALSERRAGRPCCLACRIARRDIDDWCCRFEGDPDGAPGERSSSGGFTVTVADVIPTVKVGDIQTVDVTTNPKIGCDIQVTYMGNKPSKPIQPKQTDDQGKVAFAWTVGSEATPGNASYIVNCTPFGGTTLGTASGTFAVSG